MTTKEAKNISTLVYLETLGISPKYSRKGGLEMWYCSPFREEKTESFKVDTDKNSWYDFGTGEGGSILDFVMKFHQCSIGEAFRILEGNKTIGLRKRESPVPIVEKNKVEIRSIKNLQNTSLIKYVRSRGIDISIAGYYTNEIYYRRDTLTVNFFGIGFKNNSGGYELRSKKWKGCLLNKDLTFIEHKDITTISIFEGFFDFLALLTDQGINQMKSNVIVLNSNSLIDKATTFINEQNYDKVFCFLDNDQAGELAFRKLESQLDREVKDMRYLYQGFKDYNDYLLKKQLATKPYTASIISQVNRTSL